VRAPGIVGMPSEHAQSLQVEQTGCGIAQNSRSNCRASRIGLHLVGARQ
jgi:hypothetical protein